MHERRTGEEAVEEAEHPHVARPAAQDGEETGGPAGRSTPAGTAACEFAALIELNGTIRWIDPVVHELFGYRPADVIGRPIDEFVHPDDVERARTEIARSVALQRPAPDEDTVPIRLRDRTDQWHDCEVRGTFDPASGAVVAVIVDVEARLRSTAELERQHRFEMLLGHLSAAFIDVGGDELDAAIALAVREIGEFTGAGRTCLYDLDRITSELVLLAEHHDATLRPAAWPLLRIPLDLSPGARAALESGQSLVLDDDARATALPEDLLVFLRALRLDHLAVAPIRGRGALRGLVVMDGAGAVRHWSTQDVRLVEAAATLFAHVLARRDAELALASSDRRFRELVERLPDPVLRVGRDGLPLFANRAAVSLLGLGSDRRGTDGEVPAALHPRWRATVAEVFASGAEQVLETEVERRGDRRFLQTRMVPERAADGTFASVLTITRDLTDRRRVEAELAHQALHDTLTGLPNRKLFMEHLREAIARLGREPGLVAVLFLDVDRFKVVNDSVGHGVGDELLRIVAQRLLSSVRPGDVVARLGGDEFTVLVEGASGPDDVLRAAERIRLAFDGSFHAGGHEISTSVSIGVAVTTSSTAIPTDLLRQSDAALYQAKDRGRNRVELFDDALAEQVVGRMQLESALRHAIDDGTIDVYYQPEVDLRTGEVVGAEALVRWRHPLHGLLPAETFVPVAEESGLIVALGGAVLERACVAAAGWARRFPGRRLHVRVNLSARQLAQAHLVEVVRAALTASGLDPSLLCLEITETALMTDADMGLATLQVLRELGVQLAIDDFGTGWSSLAYLKRFPVSVLKIDKSFVGGIPSAGDDLAIVATIIRLADSLGLLVTAEGVESEAQAWSLIDMGCTRGQGHLYAFALTESDFIACLEGGTVALTPRA